MGEGVREGLTEELVERGLKELREKATLISGKEYSRKRDQSVQRPCGECVPGLFKQAERPVWLELDSGM